MKKNVTTKPHMSTPCHEWVGYRMPKGYGQLRRKKKTILAHRYAFRLKHGRDPMPNALHDCDNPPCVRWEHLHEGTQAENCREATARGIWGRHGPTSENSRSAKVTPLQVEEMRVLYAAGATQKTLAESFKLHQTVVSDIVTGRTWKKAPGPIKVRPPRQRRSR